MSEQNAMTVKQETVGEALAKHAAMPPMLDATTLHKLITSGDLSGMTPSEIDAFYVYRARSAGLDPACKPFDVIDLPADKFGHRKKILYATKDCAAQLSKLHSLSPTIVKTENVNGIIYEVHARVTGPDNRTTDDIGCVSIEGAKGDWLCNAMMKAATKAKRRAILSHCGLGMLDETELETIPMQKSVPIKPVSEHLGSSQRLTETVSEASKNVTVYKQMEDALAKPSMLPPVSYQEIQAKHDKAVADSTAHAKAEAKSAGEAVLARQQREPGSDDGDGPGPHAHEIFSVCEVVAFGKEEKTDKNGRKYLGFKFHALEGPMQGFDGWVNVYSSSARKLFVERKRLGKTVEIELTTSDDGKWTNLGAVAGIVDEG